MKQAVSFKFDKTELNRWKKEAGLYNISLTEFFRVSANSNSKSKGQTAIFNQSEHAETTKQNKEMKEMNVKIIKQNELLLTKLNEAREEVKNAKEEKENIQSIATELAAMRGILKQLDASTNTSTIKALEAIPKIEQSLIKLYQQGGK